MGMGQISDTGNGSGAEDVARAREAQTAAEAIAELDGGAVGDMPDGGALSFPGPVAQAFFASDDAIAGIQGPVGSGKTTTLIYSRIRRARMMPRSTIDGVRRYKLLIIRQTYRQLWSTTIPSYLETVPKAMGEWSGGRGDPVTHRVAFEDEFGLIEWIAEFLAFGDDIISAMRGVQATDIWLNEADTVPVDVLTVGIGRIDRHPARPHFAGYPPERRSYGQIACDFNAPDEENWTHRVFHDEAERARMEGLLSGADSTGAGVRIAFFRQPGARQPGAENLHNLSPDYYPRQIAANTAAGRGDMIARLVDNEVTFLRAGDPVFRREFHPRIHVAEARLQADPRLPLLIGLDQGFTGAAVIAQRRAPRHWSVLAEMMFPTEHLMARVFGERLADLLDTRFPGHEIGGAWGDMAGEHGASQAADENATWNRVVGQAAGFIVRPQRIGSNRIQPRLEAVRASLEYLNGGVPGLLICPSCRYLRAGFQARYVWSDEIDKTGNKRKVPNKAIVEANMMDALQYLLLSQVKGNGTSVTDAPRGSSATRGRPMGGDAGGLLTGWSVTDPSGAEGRR